MNPPHVLGKFRLPIVHVLSLIILILSWIGSGNFFQALIAGAISWGIFWVLTTEIMLKFFMAGIAAALAGGAAFGLFKLAAFENGGASLAGFAIGFVTLIWAYIKLDKSSWIGTPCPHCHVRGKTDKETIHKEYLGQKTEKSGDKWVTYNLYNVTYRNWCNSCGIDWQSTGESRERA